MTDWNETHKWLEQWVSTPMSAMTRTLSRNRAVAILTEIDRLTAERDAKEVEIRHWGRLAKARGESEKRLKAERDDLRAQLLAG